MEPILLARDTMLPFFAFSMKSAGRRFHTVSDKPGARVRAQRDGVQGHRQPLSPYRDKRPLRPRGGGPRPGDLPESRPLSP